MPLGKAVIDKRNVKAQCTSGRNIFQGYSFALLVRCQIAFKAGVRRGRVNSSRNIRPWLSGQDNTHDAALAIDKTQGIG